LHDNESPTEIKEEYGQSSTLFVSFDEIRGTIDLIMKKGLFECVKFEDDELCEMSVDIDIRFDQNSKQFISKQKLACLNVSWHNVQWIDHLLQAQQNPRFQLEQKRFEAILDVVKYHLITQIVHEVGHQMGRTQDKIRLSLPHLGCEAGDWLQKITSGGVLKCAMLQLSPGTEMSDSVPFFVNAEDEYHCIDINDANEKSPILMRRQLTGLNWADSMELMSSITVFIKSKGTSPFVQLNQWNWVGSALRIEVVAEDFIKHNWNNIVSYCRSDMKKRENKGLEVYQHSVMPWNLLTKVVPEGMQQKHSKTNLQKKEKGMMWNNHKWKRIPQIRGIVGVNWKDRLEEHRKDIDKSEFWKHAFERLDEKSKQKVENEKN